jgi:hypothetical protein
VHRIPNHLVCDCTDRRPRSTATLGQPQKLVVLPSPIATMLCGARCPVAYCDQLQVGPQPGNILNGANFFSMSELLATGVHMKL